MSGPARNPTPGKERPRPSAKFWTIFGDGDANGGECSGALALDVPGVGKALAVFCHPEEAQIFVRFGGFGPRWRPKEASAEEIASALRGPCAGAGWVVLDPLPELVVGDPNDARVAEIRKPRATPGRSRTPARARTGKTQNSPGGGR